MKTRNTARLPSGQHLFGTFLVAAATWIIAASSVHGYTPEDPEVQEICKKAVKYLEEIDTSRDQFTNRLGGECLIALAIHKYYKKFGGGKYGPDHPKVAAALKRCREVAGKFDSLGNSRTYDLGTALIFLTETSPLRDFGTIQAFVAELRRIQRQEGSWGYLGGTVFGGTNGDISQTQYGVLGYWSAANVGVDAGVQPMERVMLFLARVQDPEGGWGYQARDPNSATRVAQSEVSLGRTAAGVGSILVAADYLGFSKAPPEPGKEKEEEYIDIPPVFIPVLDEEEAKQKKFKKRKRIRHKSRMPFDLPQRAIDDGNAYMEKNYRISTSQWQMYYLYALERYRSFRELMENKFEKEPKWYNDGVEMLKRRQAQTGAIGTFQEESVGTEIGTAFAVLFLLRSTRETIRRVRKAQARKVGNFGLPDDVSEMQIGSDHRVRAPKVTVAMNEIMEKLSDEESSAAFDEIIKNPGAFAIGEMDPKRSKEYTQ
ncbi:MAG TPA: hypothetical protein ENJ50_05965, partial [Planctomycetaceae bacterium]|nr:hypothetical protein [Planctomycetaceae bacterium]